MGRDWRGGTDGARRLATAVVAAVLATVGTGMIVTGIGRAGPPRLAATSVGSTADAARGTPSTDAARETPVPAQTRAVRALGASRPVQLDIPAIGVHTGLVDLGLNADGTLALPAMARGAPAGWYRFSVTPGEIGSAVIVGHVDSDRYGPAVFFELAAVRPGDTVSVLRADGRTATFTVTALAEYPKTAFPTGAVYGPVDRPALRLVTCGGAFDHVRRRYRSNVVVYAELTGSSPSPGSGIRVGPNWRFEKMQR
jgi:hypothetical protein